MDCFIVEDKKYMELMKRVDPRLFSVSLHVQQHYCTTNGCIRSDDSGKRPILYQIMEDVPEEASATGKGVRFMVPVKASQDKSFRGYMDILVCFSIRNVEGQACVDFYTELLNEDDLKEYTKDSPTDDWITHVGFQAFSIFDYVQRKAMKEKHKVVKTRRRAESKAPAAAGEPRQTPIRISSECSYTYVYEEKTEAFRHMSCPVWSVRGHYRHYKSGRTVYIAPYQKGKDREKRTAPGHRYELEDDANGKK